MKRIKIQRGYLAKKQPKKAKYYDQSLGANTVLPPRELLMHKTREERDMGRLLSYVNALQSLSKPEKAWYENVAKKTKSGWEKVKDYLSKMNLLYSYDEWDKEYEEAMREERARREKDMKKDKVKIVPTDDSRISQILRDIEQSRKKENISKYFLERDRERYRRTVPTDDVVVDDDDEDEGEYDVTDDDDDDEKGSPHQNKRDVLDENPDIEEIWMPDGSKVFKNKEVPISALTTRETPQNVSMQPVNDSSITLRPLGDNRSLIVERNDPPLGVVVVSQGNTATSLSSGEQDKVERLSRFHKALSTEFEMEKLKSEQERLNKLLVEYKQKREFLPLDESKTLLAHPEILSNFLTTYLPAQMKEAFDELRDLKYKESLTSYEQKQYLDKINDRLTTYHYLLRKVLPEFIRNSNLTDDEIKNMVFNPVEQILETSAKYKDELLPIITPEMQGHVADGIKSIIERRINPALKKRKVNMDRK